MKLKLVEKQNAVIEFNQFYTRDMIVTHCPNEITIDGIELNTRCYLNDCFNCWQKALEERGYEVEIIH